MPILFLPVRVTGMAIGARVSLSIVQEWLFSILSINRIVVPVFVFVIVFVIVIFSSISVSVLADVDIHVHCHLPFVLGVFCFVIYFAHECESLHRVLLVCNMFTGGLAAFSAPEEQHLDVSLTADFDPLALWAHCLVVEEQLCLQQSPTVLILPCDLVEFFLEPLGGVLVVLRLDTNHLLAGVNALVEQIRVGGFAMVLTVRTAVRLVQGVYFGVDVLYLLDFILVHITQVV